MAKRKPARDAHKVIFDMEDDVTAVIDMCRAVMVMAEPKISARATRRVFF
jgi:hypothetical protein